MAFINSIHQFKQTIMGFRKKNSCTSLWCKNLKKLSWRWAMVPLLLLSVGTAVGQQKNVTGSVRGDDAKPLSGATVKVAKTGVSTTTDANGRFSIPVNTGDKLIITYVGYQGQEVVIGSDSSIEVLLPNDNTTLEDVVVVGYGTQKKATLTGAVSTISGDELKTTKTQNVQNMMTGKVPGVRVVQKTSEPGDFSNEFDIRGFGSPLVVVDGVPRGTLTRLDPNEIESISVLKDAAAAVYGVRAGNGVVLITTKRGKSGKANINYSNFLGFQQPIGLPSPIGAIDRYTLFNERSMHNVDAPTITYNEDDFAPFLDGTRTSTDWYGMVMKKSAAQSQHNLSISGSSKDQAIDYFVNTGYARQDGYWKSNSLRYDRYNFRTNLNAKITEDLTAGVKINGIYEIKQNPTLPSWEIFRALWRAQPNEQYFANDNPDYLNRLSFVHPGAFSDDEISGFAKDKNTWLQGQVSLDYSIPFVEGLTARGSFAYDTRFNDNQNFRKKFDVYQYNAADNSFNPATNNAPNQVRRAYGNNPSTLLQVSLNYDKTFGEVHNVKGLFLYEEGKSSGDNFYALRELGIPLPYLFAGITQNQVALADAGGIFQNATRAYVGRVNYDFAGKYLAELSFRYDGSSRFPKNKRWGFFPAASVGWRISEENFIKDNESLAFIDNLKIRGSYGRVGDDSAISYQFISGYDYPFNGNGQGLPGGHVIDGQFINSLGFRIAPNPNITWFTTDMINVGLDAEMWNGKLGVTLELFQRDRSGLLGNRTVTVPGMFGTPLPQENLNKDQTRGIELQLSHKNMIGDFRYSISGMVALTRTKIMYAERNRDGNSYSNWRNNPLERYNDIWFGYGYTGQFQNYGDIANHSYFVGRGVLPGDYIYEDWNGDGVLDDMDRHPIATSINPNSSSASGGGARRNIPLMTFGTTFNFDYKGFDLNLLFQGGAMSYVSYGEQLIMPLAFDGNALDIFMDRWRPTDPTADPYNPATQWTQGYHAFTGTVINENSRRAIQNGAYVRLKSAELGYSLPKSLLDRAKIEGVRVFANGYNLFTVTGVKGVDPEHPSEVYGYLYPLSRTFNFGISLTF